MVLAGLAAAAEPDLGRGALTRAKSKVRDEYAKDPIGVTTSTVLVASWLFYRYEKGHNPKVTSFVDAMEFVTTNLNVGYSKIYATTPGGKLVASILMTFGPAMATRILDEPTSPDEAKTSDVVARLDRILEALEHRT
jgi:hypothetical protein